MLILKKIICPPPGSIHNECSLMKKFASKIFLLVGTLIFPYVFVLAQENMKSLEEMHVKVVCHRFCPNFFAVLDEQSLAFQRKEDLKNKQCNRLVFAGLLCM